MSVVTKTFKLASAMLISLVLSGCITYQKFDHARHIPIPTKIDKSILNEISSVDEESEIIGEIKSDQRIALSFKNFEKIDVYQDYNNHKMCLALISYRENMPLMIYEGLSAQFTVIEDAKNNKIKDEYGSAVTIEFIKMDLKLPYDIWNDVEAILTFKVTIDKAGQVLTKTFTEKSKVSGKFTGADFAGIAAATAISIALPVSSGLSGGAAQTAIAGNYYRLLRGDIPGYCPNAQPLCRYQYLVGGGVQKTMQKMIRSIGQMIHNKSI